MFREHESRSLNGMPDGASPGRGQSSATDVSRNMTERSRPPCAATVTSDVRKCEAGSGLGLDCADSCERAAGQALPRTQARPRSPLSDGGGQADSRVISLAARRMGKVHGFDQSRELASGHGDKAKSAGKTAAIAGDQTVKARHDIAIGSADLAPTNQGLMKVERCPIAAPGLAARVVRALRGLRARWRQHCDVRRTMAALNALDDRTLRDIGVNRHEIPDLIQKKRTVDF